MTNQKPLEQAVCARCGAAIDPSDHFEVVAAEGNRSAFLCRSEHIVAWVMRGAQWQVDRPWDLAPEERSATSAVKVRRARSGQIIEREFSDVEELRAWASAGAFWSQE